MSEVSETTTIDKDQYREIFVGPKKVTIPNDWDTAKLSEIALDGNKTFIDGDWVESSDMVPDGEYQLIQLGNIGEGHFKSECDKFVSEKFFNEKNCTLVEQGDLLISRLADPVLRTIIVPEFEKKSITAVDIVVAKVDEESWSKEYIWQLLNSKPLADAGNSLATGSTRQRISRSNMAKITIPRPPLPEQRQIAKILSTVDEQIQQTKEAIAETKELKYTLIQELLTKGITDDTDTKTVKIGPLEVEIPTHWNHSFFDEVIELNPRDDIPEEDSFEYLPMDAVDESLRQIQYWNERKPKNCTSVRFRQGDTIYAKITPCTENGKLAYINDIEGDIAFGSTEFLVFRAQEDNMVPKFVYYLANHPAFRAVTISLMEGSTGRQRVPTDIFKQNIKIPVPPISEQKKIVAVLDQIDEKYHNEHDRKQELEELKRGLKQDLLTGNKRVDPEQA
jgi:type I restriction enzyme S subunit